MKIIDKILPDTEYTKGRKAYKYMIVHHSGSSNKTTVENLINFFTKKDVYLSSHFIVGKAKGEVIRIVKEEDTAWHCGISEYGNDKNLNNLSIGIEVLSDGIEFNDEQRKSVADLLIYLSEKYNIKKENILRHEDIAPKRKWDIGKNFFAPYSTWRERIDSIFNKTPKEIIEKVILENSKKHDNITDFYMKEFLHIQNERLRDAFKKM